MVRLAVLPDIHMRAEEREAVERELERVVDRMAGEQPDFAVVLGDLIEDGGSADEDRRQMVRVREIVDTLECPVRYLAGNHDVANLPPAAIREIVGNDLWGYETVGEQALVFLDTAAPRLAGARGEVSTDQLDWLDRTLPDCDDALLLLHHPIHYRDLQTSYWWPNVPERAFCGNKQEINEVIEDRGGIRAVVNGHLHLTDHVRYRGLDHFTINAFNKETRDSEVTGTYAIVDLDKAVRVEVRDRTGHVVTWRITP